MVGGWALLMLHDFHKGCLDIKNTPRLKLNIFRNIDYNRVFTYSRLFLEQDWNKIDFKKFSKCFNPELEEYKFHLETLLHQLKKKNDKQ